MINVAVLWLLKRPIVAVVLTALVVGLPAYNLGKWAGYRNGIAASELANKQATLEQIKERLETDETVEGLSDADLCNAIGGVFVNGTCE